MKLRIGFCILLLGTGAATAATADLASLSHSYRKTPNTRTHAALLAYAKAHPTSVSGALALLAAVPVEIDRKMPTEALAHLTAAQKRLPSLTDYISYTRGLAQAAQQDNTAALRSFSSVLAHSPESPLVPGAAMQAAQAALAGEQPKEALKILKARYADLPQPQGDLLLASAFDASGDSVSAAAYYQRVYYRYPSASEADQAGTALAGLRQKLGDSYPTPMPQAMLGRALKLLNHGSSDRARGELDSLVQVLGGTERDIAKVSLGAALYRKRDNTRAYNYLSALRVTAPEADAERLYYMVACARRLDNHDDVQQALDRLEHQYPVSTWRLRALVSDANSHLVNNEVDAYQPLYRACYESFPGDSRAAFCHWRYTWSEYIRRRPDAAEFLKDHLRRFPKSEHVGAALYFLGRLEEDDKDPMQAKAYYREIRRLFPNSYYACLAGERLSDATLQRIPESTATVAFLKEIPFPERRRSLDFQPDAKARLRIQRAKLLSTAGLDDWAEGELRFGAKNSDQPYLLAMELADISTRGSTADQGIWSIARLAPGYLYQPLDSAPARFWHFAFPLPYRAQLERYARERSLDPYLLAAIIRQESAFNPKAVSRANAYGLTQILPSTGRDLSRRLRVRPYSTRMLFQPSLNLKLGTYYLRMLLDQLDGKWAATLASYNAGKSRAVNWLTWGEFREPAEFVETIPFSETRSYVQIVFRNADIYRRLYGKHPVSGAAKTKAKLYRGDGSLVPSSSGHLSRKDTSPAASGSEPAASLSQSAHPAVYRVGNPRDDAASHRAQSGESRTGVSGFSGSRSAKASGSRGHSVGHQSVRHHVGSKTAPRRDLRKVQEVAQSGPGSGT